MRTATAIICAGLLVGACVEREAEAPPPPPATSPAEPLTVTYVCEGGAGVQTRYEADGQLLLVFGRSEFPMSPADAVSGSRWVGESLEWWVTLEDNGEVGTLRRLGPDRVGGEVVARCARATAGGELAPDPRRPEATTEVAETAAICRAEDLSLRHVRTEAGAGQRWATFAFTNEGRAGCVIEGYPELSLQGEGGAIRADLRVERMPGPHYADRDIAPVSLAPGGEAFFDLGWGVVSGEVEGETEPCEAVAAIRAGPEAGTGTARAEVEAAPCGGRVRLTPVRPAERPGG